MNTCKHRLIDGRLCGRVLSNPGSEFCPSHTSRSPVRRPLRTAIRKAGLTAREYGTVYEVLSGGGSLERAASAIGLTRAALKSHAEQDEHLARVIREAQEAKLDRLEASLYDAGLRGNTQAAIRVLGAYKKEYAAPDKSGTTVNVGVAVEAQERSDRLERITMLLDRMGMKMVPASTSDSDSEPVDAELLP